MSSALKMKIKEWKRWKSFSYKHFYESNMKDWSDLGNPMEDRNYKFVWRIRMNDVSDTIKEDENGKS